MTPALQAALIRSGIYVVIAFLGYLLIPWALYPIAGLLVTAALGTFAAAAIANAITLRIFERAQLADIGLGWTAASRRNLSIGMLGGIGAALIVILGPVVLRAADVERVPGGRVQWPSLLFISVVLLFGAVGEEMLFRGYAFQVLIRAVGPFAIILPTSMLFALAHANNPGFTFLAGLNTFLWGVLLGYSFLRSGDLWLPIGLHFGWNWMLPVLGANLSGFTMAITGYTLHWMARPLWSGAQYGPEGSVLTTMVVPALFWFLHRAPIRQQEAFLLRPHDQELQS